jgi:parvulin-like peptidyl-prolyl isomerase
VSRRPRVSASRFSWAEIDPERRSGILLIGTIAAVVLIALGLVAYGYYRERIQPLHGTVLKVGGRSFDYSYLERRLLAEYDQGNVDPNRLGEAISQMIAAIESEELVRQAGKDLGIKVTDAEIDQQIRAKLGFAADVSPQAYAARLRRELLTLDLSLDEYRDLARAEVIARKLRARFESEIPAETDFVNLRLIRLQTQAKAIEARDRIAAGESIATVTVQMSTDPSKDNAGQLGWVPRGSLRPKLEEWAFANLGVSDIIETEDGFFILESRGHERREADEEAKGRIVSRKMEDLVAATRKKKGSSSSLTANQAQRLVRALGAAGA